MLIKYMNMLSFTLFQFCLSSKLNDYSLSFLFLKNTITEESSCIIYFIMPAGSFAAEIKMV